MTWASLEALFAGLRARAFSVACATLLFAAPAFGAGTPVGTVIENTATVSFDLAGTPTTIQTNTTTVTVAERIDVVVTLQSAQVQVQPTDTNRELLFTVTNTGNGSETFSLAIDNALAGDDFDPIAAVPAIYFDTDGSGDLTGADQSYVPGVNDPVLAADASIDVFLVNDIPAGVINGNLGRSELTATSLTGMGPAGTEYAGQGDGGVDAIIGTTTGEAATFGEYVVSDAQVAVLKAQAVLDPFGGTEPIPGATITYTITSRSVLAVAVPVPVTSTVIGSLPWSSRASPSRTRTDEKTPSDDISDRNSASPWGE